MSPVGRRACLRHAPPSSPRILRAPPVLSHRSTPSRRVKVEYGATRTALVSAVAVLLRLADRRRRLCDHGDRRHRSDGVLVADAATDRRVQLGPGFGGGRVLVWLPGLGAVE